jgi:SAM-dependent methyltransferase
MRLCPNCSRPEPIGAGEHAWPVGWACAACGHTVPHEGQIAMLAPELVHTTQGFEPNSFEVLAGIEETHFWFRARNRLLEGLLQAHFPQALSLLEVGCGNGIVLERFESARRWDRLVGSELHPEGLATARARLDSRTELIQMDARRVPFADEFDVVGAFDVLEHIEEDEIVLAEMKKALRPEGGVIIAVPQHPSLWSPADKYAKHVRRYRRGELERKLQDVGFRVAASTSFTTSLLPLMAASRLQAAARARLGAGTSSSSSGMEVKCAEPVNRILHAILDAEASLTLKGLSWPVGGSRVVVGLRQDRP